MRITPDHKIKNLIVVGDRVLIKPKKVSNRTESGLYLPPGVQEKEKIQSGYIVKVGPGYPLPLPADEDDAWKGKEDAVKYIPPERWAFIEVVKKFILVFVRHNHSHRLIATGFGREYM